MSKKLRYLYEANGINEYGSAIPDIPVVYLLLESSRGRAWGPAVVDTGFDGGVYPNSKVVRILRGLRPIQLKHLEHPLLGRIQAEVYKARCSLVSPDLSVVEPMGEIEIYVPTEPEFLGEEVLVGRELLNKLRITLDGRWVEVALQ